MILSKLGIYGWKDNGGRARWRIGEWVKTHTTYSWEQKKAKGKRQIAKGKSFS